MGGIRRYPDGPMPRILVIEDDVEIRRLVAEGLARAGYDVETAGGAMAGLSEAISGRPDVVVLDLALPDLDGSELIRMLRAVSAVPIIVATARDDDASTVALLDAGADDYLVKPYSTANLEARIRAVLRRAGGQQRPTTIKVGELEVDTAARQVTLGGKRIDLAPKEFDLLALLAERAGEVISKREILAEVWREPYGGSERTVDVHLSWLRRKLGESAQQPRYLHTIHAVGVKLMAPESREA